MNVAQLKLQIAADTNNTPIPVFNMIRNLDKDGNPTPWLSHWDNLNRRRVIMHEEVFNKIIADPTTDQLALKYELVTPQVEEGEEEKPTYHRHIVIIPKAQIVGVL